LLKLLTNALELSYKKTLLADGVIVTVGLDQVTIQAIAS
jgi:hypothetical protein